MPSRLTPCWPVPRSWRTRERAAAARAAARVRAVARARAAASAATAKDYADHIADPVAGLVTEWLEDNITQETGYVLDDSLTVEGAAADAKAVGDALKTTQENLTAGNALQLLTKQGETDSVPYIFRKSFSGDREFDKIVGGSIAWNQLRLDTETSDLDRDGINTTYDPTTHLLCIENVSRTSNYSTGSTRQMGLFTAAPIPNHKYLVLSDKTEQGVIIAVIVGGNPVSSARINGIFNNTASPSDNAFFRLRISNQYDFVTAHPVGNKFYCTLNFIDLTQMFGTAVADYIYGLEQATAGAGVAFFRAMFPESYYAYNAGELKHVSGVSAHNTVGFNQWDEEWELGYIYIIDGSDRDNSINIRSKNYIPVIPNATYYLRTSFTNAVYCPVIFYDADKNFLNSVQKIWNSTITVPSNAAYMRFYMHDSYGTTYKGDICINLSDPTRNGQYEPYDGHSYALDDSLTLRGVPKLVNNKLTYDGDTYESDGTVTRRCAVVTITGDDLSTTNPTLEGNMWRVYLNRDAYGSNNYYKEGVCATLAFKTSYSDTNNTNNSIAFNITSGNQILLRKDDLTTASAVRTYITNNPIVCVYPLATPTTETADAYQTPQICSEYGTEEYVTTGIVPVGHSTFYPSNLRKKIEGLPWNFSTLIAPNEATNKASQNYAVGSYLIMNNTLYRVTSAIASGGTITVGTNVTATTIMAEIAAL